MSSKLWDVYETDKKKELDGVWIPIELGFDENNPMFLMGILSEHNPRYREAEQKHTKPYALILAKKPKTDDEKKKQADILDDIRIRSMADGLIIDWKNVEDREGNPIEYSFENAYDLLTSLPHLYDVLARKAGLLDNFRRDKQETESKNS